MGFEKNLMVFPAGPLETNTYLLVCPKTKKAAIIDPAFESSPRVIEALEKQGLLLDKILLTHSHWDHIADLAYLKKRFGTDVWVHRADAANVVDPGCDHLPSFLAIEGVEPDGYLDEVAKIEVGSLVLEIIPTPGHSPGGVCFYLREQGILLSGDTLFKGGMGNLSLATSQPELMGKSLKKLAALPAETLVFPGHGGKTTIGAEKWLKTINV